MKVGHHHGRANKGHMIHRGEETSRVSCCANKPLNANETHRQVQPTTRFRFNKTQSTAN